MPLKPAINSISLAMREKGHAQSAGHYPSKLGSLGTHFYQLGRWQLPTVRRQNTRG